MCSGSDVEYLTIRLDKAIIAFLLANAKLNHTYKFTPVFIPNALFTCVHSSHVHPLSLLYPDMQHMASL